MRALFVLLFGSAPRLCPGGRVPFIPVNMMKVTASPVSGTVNAVGALIAEDSVILRPEIDGRIDKFLFKKGQPVKRGPCWWCLIPPSNARVLQPPRRT